MNSTFSKSQRVVMLVLALVLALTFSLAACDDSEGKFDNEKDPLMFSTLEVDKVFNPFFSTSGTDGNIVGMTQIGMLGNDSKGKYTYGDKEPVVTKDLAILSDGVADVNMTTTYYFVIKNNIKFSNGSALTIKDVLFNLYVYLDPAYTGSTTIYSTDIVGLQEYRTQESSETEQDNFKEQFIYIAESRIDNLIDASRQVLDAHSEENLTSQKFAEYLGKFTGTAYANVVEDYNKACELFGEELENDYSNSLDSYQDVKFVDKDGKVHSNLFTTDVEMFLFNEGYITWNKKDAVLTSSLANDLSVLKTWTKQQAIDTIIQAMIPYTIEEVLRYWNTSVTLSEFLVNQAMEEYFQNGASGLYPNISGIKFANRTEAVSVNGVQYDVPSYNQDGSVSSGYEVLSIKIKNVDPKAIWNFAFSVAPMYYYSDAAHIAEFDYESNFGVEYGSQTFMNTVVKHPDKISVPVGAGAYAASKSSGGITNIASGDFYNLGVIYFERNPHFMMGPATINKVRFQVVSASQILNSLYNGEIDFAEPNAKPETIAELNSKKSEGIGNQSVQTAGYGYIGINAGKVPSLAVRQAIMHSINTLECVSYYKTTASAIYRSMSMSSWAYPKNATAYYPYIGGPIPGNLDVVNPDYARYVRGLGKSTGQTLTETEQQTFLKNIVESSGYTLNGNGVYQKATDTLKYTFTIAGEETDHPAYNAMLHAGEILNKIGFQIYVTTDANALKKLATADLTVWAAAWGSTIDPDMYQVYHKDSGASSINNWGYKQIALNVGGKYDMEKALIDDLSELIDLGRRTNVEAERARIYSEALDLVMQLAVELPTYQRDDLFAYNTNKIDVSSFTHESLLSPYKGLTSSMYNISLNTVK